MHNILLGIFFQLLLRVIKCANTQTIILFENRAMNSSIYLENYQLRNEATFNINDINRKRKAAETSEGQYLTCLLEDEDDLMKEPKKHRYLRLFDNDYYKMNFNKVFMLNQNLMSVIETSFKREFYNLPPIVRFNHECTQMWYKISNIFKRIWRRYSNAILMENIDFNQIETIYNVKTLESIDLVHSNYMEAISKKECRFPKFTWDKNMLEYCFSFTYLYKSEKISKPNSVSFHSIFKFMAKSYDLKELKKLLLYKIATNKERIFYLKSIVLTMFYYYPITKEELQEDFHNSRLKSFILKTIFLIDIANGPLDKSSEISKDELVNRINDLMKKSLFVYFFDIRNIHNHLKGYNNNVEILKKYKNQNIPLCHEDFIFQYFSIGAYGYIERNFVAPVVILQQYEDFHKIPYFYLINAIERLDKVGKYIVDKTKRLYDIQN